MRKLTIGLILAGLLTLATAMPVFAAHPKANANALPGNNDGTLNAKAQGADNGAKATFGPLWFGKAVLD